MITSDDKIEYLNKRIKELEEKHAGLAERHILALKRIDMYEKKVFKLRKIIGETL